ncbi:MAG: hypothetical protein FJZ90_13975, partial [Chloroflexi bacterium]|nr:hypothetical protein [Chloroflexota bacterium]
MHESRWKDALLLLTFLALALLFFGRVTVGGRTMLPADNVFQWEPWRTFREQYGISVPHNALISDLLLENYVWKRFIVNSLRA